MKTIAKWGVACWEVLTPDEWLIDNVFVTHHPTMMYEAYSLKPQKYAATAMPKVLESHRSDSLEECQQWLAGEYEKNRKPS